VSEVTEQPEPMAEPESDDQFDGLREQFRQQMLSSLGGWTGSIITAIPTAVFVIVDVTVGLRLAIISAVGSALVLSGYRLARRQSPQQALAGLVGVVIAAFIAGLTGHAKGYFLFGIITSFVYGGALLATVLARRPAIGLLWEFLDPTPDQPAPWYRVPALARGYLLATLGGTVLFLARGVVQLTLYHDNETGWLAFARIAMGYPLYIVAVGFGVWAVRRGRARAVADVSTDA
jgi:hypothetical protein